MEEESRSEVTMEELLIDAANAISPPTLEDYELTVNKVSEVTGLDNKKAKYLLDKLVQQKKLERRMVVHNGARCIAYSTPGLEKRKGWENLIKELREENDVQRR